MKRTGHIRQRSPGSFEIRYSLGTDPLTGKRNIKTTTFKGTRKAVEVELRRLLRTVDTGEHLDSSKITVAQFLKQWLDTTRATINPKSYERYAEIVNNSLIPAFGHCKLVKLTGFIIQEAYIKWETSGRRDGKEGGLSPRTRAHIHRILKSALKHAVKLRLILRNPADDVKAPKAGKATIKTHTIEQTAILLRALRDTRLYYPVLLAIVTGMRRGEVLALRWKNVDFENKTIRVVESLEQVKQELRFKEPKTGKTRAVILLDHALQDLRAWRIRQAEELLRLGVRQDENTLVCARWDGQPLKPDSLTGEFRIAIRKIPEVPTIRYHDLRHSHATQLLTNGIHPKIAQERLGHASIKTTLDLYSHVTETMQEEAAEKLDNAFKSVINGSPKQP